MYYRNEWKYLVTDADLAVLGARLKVLLPMDKHQTGSAYAIRSLYFDDLQNSCLRENEAGVDDRRKFRLRLYNGSSERIQLEIKEKLHGKTHKSSCLVSADECRRIMAEQGRPEPNGRARLTEGYNLPARYVLHTVGPIVRGRVTGENRRELASCYRACLELAAEHGLHSVAFCCISTGEFRFPNREAAGIAVDTVTGFLRRNTSIQRVIFNVFQELDERIYRSMLGGG